MIQFDIHVLLCLQEGKKGTKKKPQHQSTLIKASKQFFRKQKSIFSNFWAAKKKSFLHRFHSHIFLEIFCFFFFFSTTNVYRKIFEGEKKRQKIKRKDKKISTVLRCIMWGINHRKASLKTTNLLAHIAAIQLQYSNCFLKFYSIS